MRYGKKNCRLLDVNLLKPKSFFFIFIITHGARHCETV